MRRSVSPFLMAAYLASCNQTAARPREFQSRERTEREKQISERDAWNREVERKKAEKKGRK